MTNIARTTPDRIPPRRCCPNATTSATLSKKRHAHSGWHARRFQRRAWRIGDAHQPRPSSKLRACHPAARVPLLVEDSPWRTCPAAFFSALTLRQIRGDKLLPQLRFQLLQPRRNLLQIGNDDRMRQLRINPHRRIRHADVLDNRRVLVLRPGHRIGVHTTLQNAPQGRNRFAGRAKAPGT